MYANNNTHFTYINDVRDARNTPLLYYGQLKHECRLWHAQHKPDTHITDDDDNDVVQHQRQKRSILISPGTQWCGSGARAEHASDLGENSETDQCCREHDGCPYIIEGLSTRYGYFNYRFYTMSYCECDRKFFECLKRAGTGTSSIIGKVFFNVVNRNCFELKRDKVCAKYSFWGSCNKYRVGLTADVKDSLRF
jgi:secretory phospholipase A2